ncbi:MAG TPA: hypothetical protein PKO22_01925 [Treponemataceae bacterium]|nr:hypothetical protein [Treponemataceae bacterium]
MAEIKNRGRSFNLSDENLTDQDEALMKFFTKDAVAAGKRMFRACVDGIIFFLIPLPGSPKIFLRESIFF